MPQAVWIAMFLVIAASSILTLLGSIAIIVLYRRAVLRAMNQSGFDQVAADAAGRSMPDAAVHDEVPTQVIAVEPPHADAQASTHADALHRRARQAPWHAARDLAIAGLAFALVLAAAYSLATPAARTLPRFAMTTWVDAWPVVLAAALVAPRFLRWGAIGAAIYFVPFVLGSLYALLTLPAGPDSLDAGIAAAQTSVTPPFLLFMWSIYAGIPTVLLLLFLNRWTRAVSPMLLAFTTIVTAACIIAWFLIFTERATAFVIDSAVATGLSVYWLLLGALLAVIAVSGLIGWWVLSRVRKAYLAKRLSDRSLDLDALWLIFASYFAMQFALQGAAWLIVGVLAFAAYKVTLNTLIAHDRRRRVALAPHGLTFLRVFSLGSRSNALFESLGKHWRRIGSMQLITGPDVAHSTVQPHQLLDFMAGRLANHFIGDRGTLAARMSLQDRVADRDGWFRVNNFFCRADAWQAVLTRLVGAGDAILMDLRSFSSRNAGCVHELRHLLHFVPLDRCVFVIDETTDQVYLRSVIDDEWKRLSTDSPNRSFEPERMPFHRFDASGAALNALLQRLCQAASSKRV